jgi:hypothetical protein
VRVREECEVFGLSESLNIPSDPRRVERYERMIERGFMKGLITQGGAKCGAGNGRCPLIPCPQALF